LEQFCGWQEQEIFVSITVQTALWADPTFCPLYVDAVSFGIKQLEHKADRSPSSSARVKNSTVNPVPLMSLQCDS
jgi:hypothetical protein